MHGITQELEIERWEDELFIRTESGGDIYLTRDKVKDVAKFDALLDRVKQMYIEMNAAIAYYSDELGD